MLREKNVWCKNIVAVLADAVDASSYSRRSEHFGGYLTVVKIAEVFLGPAPHRFRTPSNPKAR